MYEGLLRFLSQEARDLKLVKAYTTFKHIIFSLYVEALDRNGLFSMYQFLAPLDCFVFL